MIVTRSNIAGIVEQLDTVHRLALDTETTGLRPYHGDFPFSFIVADAEQSYYFNFNDYPDMGEEERLDWRLHGPLLHRLFTSPGRLWYLHNAKFDLAQLERMGFEVLGTIHDCMIVARVLDSTLWQGDFSLDACAARDLGERKDDGVKNYLLLNKLYTTEKSEGKKTTKKNLHFSLAPWDIIVPYGEKDGRLTYRLGEHQREQVTELDKASTPGLPLLRQVYANEVELTRTVYEMERQGVLIDRPFCLRAAREAEVAQSLALNRFEALAGEPFKDSTIVFQRVFESDKERWVYGEPTPKKGIRNPSFDTEVLETFKHPAARCILDWRKAKSDANYYHGFLYEADAHDVIHASFNQHVAATGRFSSSNPNLQNLTKNDDEELTQEFVVRRAIVPRPGMVFHMLDFDQMEYRLMLDYAARFAFDKEGVLTLIDKVLGGLDVHQATADIASVSRRFAKTVNFLTLYGGGVTNLAGQLGVSESEARAIRDKIFGAAPEILTFIRRVTGTAEKRGFIVNWFGRRCRFPDATFAYRAPNYLIQGGCADIVKVVMNQTNSYLRPFRTRLVLMIHDELVLEGPPSEAAEVIPAVRKIMESVYPARLVPLTCGVDHSFKSLADKVEGIAV